MDEIAIRKVCGEEYALDIPVGEGRVFVLYFNSLQNAQNVKAIMEADKDGTVTDFRNVVHCRNCEYHHWEQEPCHGKTVHMCAMLKTEVFKEFWCYYGKPKNHTERRTR